MAHDRDLLPVLRIHCPYKTHRAAYRCEFSLHGYNFAHHLVDDDLHPYIPGLHRMQKLHRRFYFDNFPLLRILAHLYAEIPLLHHDSSLVNPFLQNDAVVHDDEFAF